ncbi:MAG: cystathionine gamma-lyase [Burkholderiales bacterium]|nr:cystathionine gamma-lyase [Burkholderiales bacterium]
MNPSDNDERVARALHHAGVQPAGAPLTPPLVLTTAYVLPGDPAGDYQYARWANPTWTALDAALALLEDAPVVTFPSGMAAIAAVFYGLLKAGDRILLPADGYYTTRILAERFLVPLGVAFDLVATAALGQKSFDGYRLVMIETPSNPALDLADIRAVSAAARAAGAIVAVDNTMMTPLGQRPLELGADLLVSADTKALNGHSDVLFGHVASREPKLLDAVRDWRRIAGAIPGPFEAWLVHRGIETLELRFARMSESALALAGRLRGHRAVRSVVYPGLPEHPAHQLARRQMRGFGSIVGVTLADKEAAERFIGGCRFVRAATSFGGLHTSAERRARWGDQVADGFIRLSVGCEPLEALWRDMQRSLDAL